MSIDRTSALKPVSTVQPRETNEAAPQKTRLEKTLESRRSEEMDYFMRVFVPSFHLSLDEISQDDAARQQRYQHGTC